MNAKVLSTDELDELRDFNHSLVDKALATIDQLERERKECMEALRPFADGCVDKARDVGSGRITYPDDSWMYTLPSQRWILARDLRRAAELLARLEGGK